MKHSKTIRMLLAGVLTAVAVAGCNQKPPATAATSNTNVPSPAAAAGAAADSRAVSNSIPLRTIVSLMQNGTSGVPNGLVLIRGTVLDERPGEFIVVNDGTGTVFAETDQAALPQVKEAVELSGLAASDGFSVTMKHAMVRPLATGSSSNSPAALSSVKPAELPLLTNVWAIRDLPPEKATWHYPVRLRTVVTVNAHYKDYFFAQDDSAGISVRTGKIPVCLNPGDLVDIEGVSDPGDFSPIVLASNVTVIGSAPLPKAKPETLFELATGKDGSQWIEVQGVVRAVAYTNGMAKLDLRNLNGTIRVNFPATNEPAQLLDSVARIKGACGTLSSNRLITGYILWASSLADVQIEEPGVSDPLSRPVQSIASLSEFHPRQTLQHRVSIAGVVTYVDLNDSEFFFLQDANDAVRVNAQVTERLKPGDYVVAAGYPGIGNYGSLLENSVFKVIGHRQMPPPVRLTKEKPVDPQLHDRWVQIEARFLHYSKIGTVDVLTLQIGNRVFDARILAPVSARITNLKPGSLLQVTGIYRVLSDEARVPNSLQLAVPAEDDIQVLEEPSWWTISHTFTVLGIMAVVIGATVLWVLLLRRKVRERTASLKQSEGKFRSLVEQSLVGVYIIQDERFVYASPRMASIFGYTPKEFVDSCRIENVVHWEDRPFVREQIRRRIDAEVEFAHHSFRGLHKNGSLIHLEVHGSRTEFAGKPAVLGTLLDISERKLAQDKIAEQARMLDLASDAIMVCDIEDRIRYWNRNAHRIYGWTEQEAVGGIAHEKLHISPADFQKAKAALLQNHHWQGEFNHRDHHGGELTVAARWTLVHDSLGNPDSILTINTDVTRQKKLEAQFLRTQRLDSIGVLAGGIAHDLNNILAPILMSGQLLEMEPNLSTERKNLIAGILASTQRAASLVRQILTFARGTTGHRQTLQPAHALDELRKILNGTFPKSISLHFSIATDTPTIVADATQLHQVLMNLCINARDAMPQRGELTVAVAGVKLEERDAVLGGEAGPGSYVVFTVTDTGSGMTPQIRDRIFDPFFTTKEVGKGTGLGLSTALGIVKSHGGFIRVQSQPGHGSSFNVYLPAQAGTTPAAETPRKDSRIRRGNNELILIVEDEAPLRDITKHTLILHGYRVVTAENGAEAVACYTRQKDEIALVLTDMMMPVMDGPATIQALARINPGIKIIAASGRTTQSQINSPAVRAFLSKPYAAETMLNVIHEVLGGKTAGDRVVS